jgi:hypothetical protein
MSHRRRHRSARSARSGCVWPVLTRLRRASECARARAGVVCWLVEYERAPGGGTWVGRFGRFSRFSRWSSEPPPWDRAWGHREREREELRLKFPFPATPDVSCPIPSPSPNFRAVSSCGLRFVMSFVIVLSCYAMRYDAMRCDATTKLTRTRTGRRTFFFPPAPVTATPARTGTSSSSKPMYTSLFLLPDARHYFACLFPQSRTNHRRCLPKSPSLFQNRRTFILRQESIIVDEKGVKKKKKTGGRAIMKKVSK